MIILETRDEQLSFAHAVLREMMPEAEISLRRHYAIRSLEDLRGSVYSTEIRDALERELTMGLDYASRHVEEEIEADRQRRRAEEREEMFR